MKFSGFHAPKGATYFRHAPKCPTPRPDSVLRIQAWLLQIRVWIYRIRVRFCQFWIWFYRIQAWFCQTEFWICRIRVWFYRFRARFCQTQAWFYQTEFGFCRIRASVYQFRSRVSHDRIGSRSVGLPGRWAGIGSYGVLMRIRPHPTDRDPIRSWETRDRNW